MSFISLTMVYCRKPDNQGEIVNLNGNKIGILGHGGMGISHFYPMNSEESLNTCLELDVDGTELDIQLSKDGILVVFHDEDLSHSTDQKGKISEMEWSEIKKACYKNPPLSNHPVIGLDDFLSQVNNLSSVKLFLDCKIFSNDHSTFQIQRFNNALLNIIDKYGLINQVVVEQKEVSYIKDLKRRRSEIEVYHYTTFENGISLSDELKTDGLIITYDLLDKSKVREAHQKGLKVCLVNARTQKRNIDGIESNVDFIQSDRLKHLIRVLK